MMTNKQLTTLIKKTVVNTMEDFFNDPDFGKEVKKSFLKSLEESRNNREGSLTVAQFRRQYGF